MRSCSAMDGPAALPRRTMGGRTGNGILTERDDISKTGVDRNADEELWELWG